MNFQFKKLKKKFQGVRSGDYVEYYPCTRQCFAKNCFSKSSFMKGKKKKKDIGNDSSRCLDNCLDIVTKVVHTAYLFNSKKFQL